MATQDFKRKLTAILSADVKGYSRLMGEDEEATVRTITAHRKVITSVIEKYRGRVVDSPGDNILAEFVSVVDAAQSAVEIQEVIRAKNAELPEDRRMEFRIGINLGDVIQEGERIYGDGVNIAARVEGLADPGGICISGSAYEQIENKLALGYDYIGEHTVKNIVKPIRVYRVPTGSETLQKVTAERRPSPGWQRAAFAVMIALVVVAGGLALWRSSMRTPSPPVEVASVEKMAFPLPEKPSIAVLPFDNFGGDPKQDYFSDGITENIITALSKISNLFVIARKSTFTYKGKPVKVQQVAEELGVRYVLEGGVQRVDERVRITAQLIDGLTGRHLWAERYDRQIGDIFALQDDITNQVVTALEVKLTEGEAARVQRRQTDNTEAYDLFRRALEQYRRFTKVDNAQAQQLFKEALALDSGFADAWCFLGETYQAEWYFGWSENAAQSLARATELAQKAIALDDSSPCPYILLDIIHLWSRDYDQAIAYGEKAVALEPNHADATVRLARALTYADRPEEAIDLIKRAMRLSPYYPDWYLGALGVSYRLAGNYDEAIAAFEKRRERNPRSTLPHLGLAVVYMEVGREQEARDAAAEVLKRNPKTSLKQVRNRLPYKGPSRGREDYCRSPQGGLAGLRRGNQQLASTGKEGETMIVFPSVRAYQRATGPVSAMILVAVLMLPLACASIGQKGKLNEVKSKVEATWILEEWHMKGEVVGPPKVASRFVIRDNAILLIMLNRAGEPPWSYYGYGKYTLDASTFSMGFDETSFVKESSSGVTVSHKLLWDGKMMPFVIRTENNQLHMRCDDIDYDIIVDGNTLILKIGGKIVRTYRRAGIE